jgi:hypothetical protein
MTLHIRPHPKGLVIKLLQGLVIRQVPWTLASWFPGSYLVRPTQTWSTFTVLPSDMPACLAVENQQDHSQCGALPEASAQALFLLGILS